MQCSECRWHVELSADPDRIECHRRAPLVTGGMMSEVETVWPIVPIDDFCGEFQPTGDHEMQDHSHDG